MLQRSVLYRGYGGWNSGRKGVYHFSYEPYTKRALGEKGYQLKFENYVSNLRPNVNKKLYGIAL